MSDTKKIDMWINGSSTAAVSGLYYEDLNPLDDSVYASVARGGHEDMLAAVDAAHTAFETYKHSLPVERETWLANAAQLLTERADEVINIIIDEGGSPIYKARIEVKLATACIRAAAAMPRALSGHTYASDTPGRLSMSIRSPLGVSLNITPFNVPLILGARCVNALACGNTVVLLPSEEAPGVAEFLGRLFKDAGFPAGSFNYVTGYGHEIGDSLVSDHRVKAVTFTGSTRVGSHIMELASTQRKPVVLEMGGKSPMVVLDDADIDQATTVACQSSFGFQGQACMASSRIYVQRGAFNDFVEAFSKKTEQLGVGNLRDDTTIIGPIINKRQRSRVRSHIEQAIELGARVIAGGHWEDNRCHPTILTGVTEAMSVCREETFGPVTSVYPIDTLEEAISLSNDSNYGLSAAIFTSNLDAAMRFAKEVESGMVHINASTIQDEPHAPFGGVKDSGYDRESISAAIEGMTQQKWVTIAG